MRLCQFGHVNYTRDYRYVRTTATSGGIWREIDLSSSNWWTQFATRYDGWWQSWSSCPYFEVVFLTGIHYNGTIVKVEMKWVKNI